MRSRVGNPHNLGEAGSLGRAVLMEGGLAEEIAPVLRSVRSEGATTLRSITHALNRRGINRRVEVPCILPPWPISCPGLSPSYRREFKFAHLDRRLYGMQRSGVCVIES
jgi:hypothetical protein